MNPLLKVEGVSVRYGGTEAVSEADVVVERGEIVGLIGPNGAGKTSLVDAVTGFAPVAAGRVRFADEDITHWSPHRRARLGLGRTWQGAELFEELTIRDNLAVASHRPRWWSVLADVVAPRRSIAGPRAEAAVELLGIEGVLDRLPTEISTGTQRLAAIARALATGPELLLLDEPAAGLDSSETEQLRGHLRTILGQGVTILVIDHDMNLMMSACDRLYVLDLGRVISQGDCATVQRDPLVVEAYLGTRRQGLLA